MTSTAALERAEQAVANGEWAVALARLDDAGAAAGTCVGLELRAMASYGNGDFEACITAWEDLHEAFLADNDTAEAARAAAMIAMYLMMDTGLMAPVRGWLRRAEGLAAGLDPAPAHALIAMTRTYERFMCGDMDEAGRQSAAAIRLGTELDVAPAVVIGRVAGARVRIFQGDLDGGLAELDEIGALLMSGAVDHLTTGMMYCELICAAQGLARHDMAAEWTEVMERWRHGAAFGGIHGRCRVHRAEMLRMSGPCDAAEEEALGACDDLRPWMRREFGWPLAELGNIRLRRGDLDGAEEAFLAANEHAWSPHPGLALLRLARDDTPGAAALIAEAIAHPVLIPSKERPPFGDLHLAPLLDAQVEIAAAAEDHGTALAAAHRLRDIAADFPGAGLEACADLADARVALLEGDSGRAVAGASAAMARWAGIGAPFETAVARTVLARAQEAAGNRDTAMLEWQTAAQAFATYGADRWARMARRRAEDTTGADGGAEPPAPTAESATFALGGDTRTVTFGGDSVVVKDLKGYRYLERLIGDPDREFHVLDLVAVEQGTLPAAGVSGSATAPADEGMAVLDDQAREAYRRRLAEVEADIDEAMVANDRARAELAERDRDYLVAELARAVGLGGRMRSVGSDAERARTAVTRSLRYALAKLADHHPAAADHLERSLQTGTYCAYRPDPRSAVTWIT